MIDGEVGAVLVQHWLGAKYPKLADECDRVQGVADIFAEIVIAINDHAEDLGRDVSTFRPVARIDGAAVRIDLY